MMENFADALRDDAVGDSVSAPAERGPVPRHRASQPREIGPPDTLGFALFRSFGEAETIWRAVEAKCDCSVFQSFDWLATWQATIGTAEDIRPCIVHVTDRRGETAMLWPLGMKRARGLRVLVFLGGIVTDYNAPLIPRDVAGAVDAAFLEALIPRLVRMLPPADVIAFERIPLAPGVGAAFAGLPGARHVWSAHLARLPNSFEAFKRSRSTKLFSDSARRWRRLSAIGEPRMILSPEPDARAPIFDAFVRQKSRRWQETGATNLFARPAYRAFYAALVEKHAGTGGFIHLSALAVDDKIVATHLGAIFRDRFYYLMPGHEAGEWGRYSVGRLLMQRLIQESIERRLVAFDLTVGDEAYKAESADVTTPLFDYRRGITVRGRLYQRSLEMLDRVKSAAKRSKRLHALVQRLRSKQQRRTERS